ncbi:hypothetical protein R6Q57_016838 [Mikania cordata]
MSYPVYPSRIQPDISDTQSENPRLSSSQRNHPRPLSSAQSRYRSVKIIDTPSSSAFSVTISVDYILSAQSRSRSAEINDATSSSALSRSISVDYIQHWFLYSLQVLCHRDLKLENTLLNGSPAPRLKICDFGYSKILDLEIQMEVERRSMQELEEEIRKERQKRLELQQQMKKFMKKFIRPSS